ncbi:MAG: MgtC/SapB family protein [Prevotella sp.]|nr:MgtC/SapB family protein [Prevotella sp.]MDD5895616.1 MgtC/SapB family protein [Prevotellaceae bacterium]
MPMILDITLRLVAAMVLGGSIGIEREFRSKDAGFRTHFLVALGSALFTVVSQYGFGIDLKDSSRVAAQVVSGIGFLGAGTIIFQKNMVRGLTTAAGLWVTAAIGLACGTGLYLIAAITTTLVLVGLEALHTFIPQLGKAAVQLGFTSGSKTSVAEVLKRLKAEDIDISTFEMKSRTTKDGDVFDVNADIRVKRGGHNERILNLINEFDDVTISHLE